MDDTKRDNTRELCEEDPFKPLSSEEIFAELVESRECYKRGEGENFDDALDEISANYGL